MDEWELIGEKTIEATVVEEERPAKVKKKKPFPSFLKIFGAIAAFGVGVYLIARSRLESRRKQ